MEGDGALRASVVEMCVVDDSSSFIFLAIHPFQSM